MHILPSVYKSLMIVLVWNARTNARTTLFFFFKITLCFFPGGSEDKVSACNAGDLGWIPVSGRFPGEGNGNPLQYSCLENPMGGGAW